MPPPPDEFLISIDLDSFALKSSALPYVRRKLLCFFTGYVDRITSREAAIDHLMNAYHIHGPRLSAHLLGQYAAAIVDTETRCVVLTQDSLGVGKLFYRWHGGALQIASRIAPLIAPEPFASLNKRYFALQLTQGSPLRTDTPFNGLACLAYGKTMIIDVGGSKERRPWAPDDKQADISDDDVSAELRRLLDEAVESAMPDGAVACELSGGLDSTSVFVTAAHLRAQIYALTFASSSGRNGDDDAFARIAVEAFPNPHILIDQDDHPPFAIEPDRFEEESGGDTLTSLRKAYEEALERVGIAAIFTGDGGDVIFGYGHLKPAHLADPFAQGAVLEGVRAARRWAREVEPTRPTSYFVRRYGLRYAWRHIGRRSLVYAGDEGVPPWLTGSMAAEAASVNQIRPQVAPRISRPGQQYLWEMIYDLAGQANDAYRRRLRASSRHPLLHRPLVSFMLSLPPTFRHGADGDRVAQRRAFADRLPEPIRRRTTKGSAQQLHEQALMTNEAWYRALTRSPRLVDLGWVDGDRWRLAVDRARFGVFESYPQFNAAMLTELWLQSLERYGAPKAPQLTQVTMPYSPCD